jgi:hypothetical protein
MHCYFYKHRSRSGTMRKRLNLPLEVASDSRVGPGEARYSIAGASVISDNRKEHAQKYKEEHPNAETGEPPYNNSNDSHNSPTSNIALAKRLVCYQTTILSPTGCAWVAKPLYFVCQNGQ